MEKFHEIEQQEWPVHEFTYLSPDRCRNMTAEERRPLVAEYWAKNDPWFNDGIGAESFADLMARVENFIGQVKSSESELTAVFSHGQFIRAVIWRILGGKIAVTPAGMKKFRNFTASFDVFNASTARVQKENDGSFWISSMDSSYLPGEYLT